MKNYLGFTVLAAIVTTFGTLTGLFLKEFIFVRYFDNLKEQKTLEKISQKYKDPILLSSSELLRRFHDYAENYVWLSKYSSTKILFDKVDKMQSIYITDPYFLNYKLLTTLYRFCSFFAWLELYRQEVTFLDSQSKSKNFHFLSLISHIREAIADGQINTGDDWDVQIYREELRAIGEGMIENNGGQKTIIGYGKFRMLISQYETNKEPFWLNPAINFFTDLRPEKDFRLERFKRMTSTLTELIKYLDNDYYERIKPTLTAQFTSDSIRHMKNPN
ncbi:MAG: hypothetical protein ABIQ40_09605 [Bacteroidia bacterium]